MIDLKRGIVVQYHHENDEDTRNIVVTDIFYDDLDVLEFPDISGDSMPHDSVIERMPNRIPYSSVPKAGHWNWAKPWSVNNG